MAPITHLDEARSRKAAAAPAAGDTRPAGGLRLPPGIEPAPAWVPARPTVVEVLAGAAAGAGIVLARPFVLAILRAADDCARSRRPGVSRPDMQPSTRPDTQPRTRPDTQPSTPAGARPGADPLVIAAARRDRDAADPGWFGPDSVAWKVQADPAMFVAGVAAFALQLLHPLALAGVIDHSSFAEDFTGRVLRTGAFVQGVVFGGSAEAAARVAGVKRVHTRVVGTAPDGRHYDAAEPDLLRWVHIGEYLAIAAAYRRFGAYPLSRAELDGYVAEVAAVGEAMGAPDPPRSWEALEAAAQRFRPELAVSEQTIAALRFLRHPAGLPPLARPAWEVLFAGATACIPPWARKLLGLRAPSPAELITCRSLVRGLAALLGDPPPLLAARARLGLSRS